MQGWTLQPGEAKTLTRQGQPMAMNNRGDTIELITPQGQAVQSVMYQTAEEGDVIVPASDEGGGRHQRVMTRRGKERALQTAGQGRVDGLLAPAAEVSSVQGVPDTAGRVLMRQTPISSREYKIMLRTSRFAGTDDALCQHAAAFWHAYRQAMRAVVYDTDGNLNTITQRRRLRFYDTPGHRLWRQAYMVRERADERTGARELMLKYRHPDRYVAQAQDLDAAQADSGKTKFEEDIKPPFQTLYSLSTTQQMASHPALNTLGDIGHLYPGLPTTLDGYQADAALTVVGSFTAQELVLTGADVQLGKDPKREAECALIAWYDVAGSALQPVVVECSFRYGDKDGDYKSEVAQRAYDVFQRLQSAALASWVDRVSPTKTAYVYSRAQEASR